MTLPELFKEARKRDMQVMSITDHDSIDCQESAKMLAEKHSIHYIYGLEINVTYAHPGYRNSKPVSLDFLGYQYDSHYLPLEQKLKELREYRRKRAEKILDKINAELVKDGLEPFTQKDLDEIQNLVEGAFGRPHIAEYLIKKGIVSSHQEAFDRYLVKCDVSKFPLSLAEASSLIRNAGGIFVLAHPNDPNGTSLVSITSDLDEQTRTIEGCMLEYIDGIECWHSRNDDRITAHYIEFSKRHHLLMTGGSDCHQKPILMGTLDIPDWVAGQFGRTAPY